MLHDNQVSVVTPELLQSMLDRTKATQEYQSTKIAHLSAALEDKEHEVATMQGMLETKNKVILQLTEELAGLKNGR